MAFIRDMLNTAKTQVESKVVESRVRKALDSLKIDDLDEGINAYAQLGALAIKTTGTVIKKIFNDNKEDVIKLAGDNSKAIIKISELLTEIGNVINSMDTEENREALKAMEKRSLDIVDSEFDAVQEEVNELVKSCETSLESFMIKPKKDLKYFILNIEGSFKYNGYHYDRCTKEEYDERKRKVMKDKGSFHNVRVRNKLYETPESYYEKDNH